MATLQRAWNEALIAQTAAEIRAADPIVIVRKTIVDRPVEDFGPYIQVGYLHSHGDSLAFFSDVKDFDRSDDAWIAAICRERAIVRLYPGEVEDTDDAMGMAF